MHFKNWDWILFVASRGPFHHPTKKCILVPQGAFFDLPDSPSCSAGTCENVDLEKKELLIRPYPTGLEEDFTLPYDVPWQNHWCKTNMRQWSINMI